MSIIKNIKKATTQHDDTNNIKLMHYKINQKLYILEYKIVNITHTFPHMYRTYRYTVSGAFALVQM